MKSDFEKAQELIFNRWPDLPHPRYPFIAEKLLERFSVAEIEEILRDDAFNVYPKGFSVLLKWYFPK